MIHSYIYPVDRERNLVPHRTLDDHLANVTGALVRGLADHIESATETASGHVGAAPAALVALTELLDHRSVDDLRHAVDLTHSGAVRLVDRLVDDGLAERRPGPDRRSVALALTPRGRRLAVRTSEARRAAVADVLEVLDARERDQLAAIADKLVRAVVDQRLAARRAGDDPAGGWLCRLCDPTACGRSEGRCPAASAATGDRS
jgi:DNA-binding MarR family transcriptional regulator